MVEIKKVSFLEKPNCLLLSNGEAEIILTTDIGPRISAYRFVGGENILSEVGPARFVETELGKWYPWGGHRLWYAPEIRPRCYTPDNDPVNAVNTAPGTVHLTQKTEEYSKIAKEMIVSLDEKGTHVTINHKLTNEGVWPVELGPWGLTVMSPGGYSIFPNEPFQPHAEACLPARRLVVWTYTDLSDRRLTFGRKYIKLQNEEDNDESNKIGGSVKAEWAGYIKGDVFFIKRFPYIDGAEYPDLGCNFETYTKARTIEVESMGPMVKLEPGQSTFHVEDWYLYGGFSNIKDEEALDAAITPLLEKSHATV